MNRGATQFRVFATKARTVSVVSVADGKELSRIPMTGEKGLFEVTAELTSHDYFYCIDNEKMLPDPASRWQPFGVHGPSRIYSSTFNWSDQLWKGIPLQEYIIYEIHVGTFTPEGTFDALCTKLPYLKELGVTAIELMPIVEFSGDRNWGYDGVYPYAPHHRYGGPDGLKRCVNACHEWGIALILDVVYNHLGPEGNYLNAYGHYFSDSYKTPWGDALNFDRAHSEPVRNYFIDNALYWLTEYHVDGLRLDAVQTMHDMSPCHILEQVRNAFHSQSENLGRQAFIIAESDLNDVRILKPLQEGGYALDAQWSDDFHHALHTLVASSKWKYFADFGTLAQLAKAITDGFVYDGIWSEYRQKIFGSSSKDLPGEKFVFCMENHDQIGNAGQGRRLGSIISEDSYKLASLLLFCAPGIPLLFMGQEWNATTPFHFFTSFEDPDLCQKVREGFRKENHVTIDPQSVERYNASKLQWQQVEESSMLSFYCKLIDLRKRVPCLSNCRKDLTQVCFNEEEKWLLMTRSDPSGSNIILVANFSHQTLTLPVEFSSGHWHLLINTADSEDSTSFFIEKSILRPIQLLPFNGCLFGRLV